MAMAYFARPHWWAVIGGDMKFTILVFLSLFVLGLLSPMMGWLGFWIGVAMIVIDATTFWWNTDESNKQIKVVEGEYYDGYLSSYILLAVLALAQLLFFLFFIGVSWGVYAIYALVT